MRTRIFIEAPCKDCMERHEGCHGSCVKYMDWKQHLEVVNKEDDIYYQYKQDRWLHEREKKRRSRA